MKKYEREIRELLDKLDTFVPDSPATEKERPKEREPEREVRRPRPVGVMPPQPIPIRPRRSMMSRIGTWLTEHQIGMSLRLMLGGLGLVIVALIIRQYTGSSLNWLSQLLAAAGAIVFLTPVLMRFFRGKSLDGDSTAYWRGQSVESEHFSWGSFRKWIGGNKRNRRNKNNPWDDRNRPGRW